MPESQSRWSGLAAWSEAIIERYDKASVLFVAVVYALGFIVTASRLAEYDITLTKLLDAQYFVAGLLPTLLLIVTVVVIRSALNYLPSDLRASFDDILGLPDWIVMILFALVIVAALWFPALGGAYHESGADAMLRTLNQLAASGSIPMLLFGEFCLWISVVVWKSIWQRARSRPSTGPLGCAGCLTLVARFRTSYLTLVPLYLLAVLTVLIIAAVTGPTIRGFYLTVPQAFGGAKPVDVIMYVDKDKVPPALIATPIPVESPARTAKLQLLFHTSDFYIVTLGQTQDDPAWAIQADAVHAITRAP